MDKERISIVSFGQQYVQCCSTACFSDVFKQYKHSPRKMGQVCRASRWHSCVRMSDAYANATFAREATFFIFATLRPADWERKTTFMLWFFWP